MHRFNSYVTDVKWKRIYLSIVLETEEGESFPKDIRAYLLNDKALAETAFQVVKNEGSCCEIMVNVSNSGINRCINNGTYTILIADEAEERISEPQYEGEVEDLLRWSHVFRYDNSNGAYTVSFMLDEEAPFPRFQILFFNAYKRAMGNMPVLEADEKEHKEEEQETEDLFEGEGAKAEYKERKAPLWRRCLTKSRRKKLASKIYKFARKFKTSKKKCIVFFSQQDDSLTTNMKALYDRMLERGLDKEYEIRLSLRNSVAVKQPPKESLRMVLDAARADVLILDDHAPLFNYLVISPDTVMIQIWHAGAGFKGVGYSRWGHYGCPGPFSCHRQYTYAVSASARISGFFSEQFGILDEQVIPAGMPRMDSFLDEEKNKEARERLYASMPSLKGRKVILFAPTYRGRNRKSAYYPYEKIDFEGLYDLCLKKNAAVLFKMHPWVNEPVPLEEQWKDRFFDMNTYPDINELFSITDVLITDYSSSMFEYALLNKPMLAFAFDKVQFAASRGFHRNYDENVPGKICSTFEELLKALWNEDYEYEKHESYMERHFDHTDTHNADRVIDWLVLGNLPEEYARALEEKKDQVEALRGRDFGRLVWNRQKGV